MVQVAHAAPAAAAQAYAFGVVDEDKLAEKYTAYRDAVAVLDKKAQNLDSQLAARELLTDDEGKSFDALILKPTRTAAEEDTLKKLVDAGTGRRAEYTGLLARATRTDVENARIKTLEDQAKANGPKLQGMSDGLYNDIKKEQEETDKTYTERANNTIALVAADKKLTLVVRQRAVIWYSPSVDITDEVLARLNK
jgi:Skp family chaperone for outer membrane proteins